MSEELDRLLGAVRHEGALESEGRFTLDPARALELMSRYALPEPRRYVLNLVSWAAAAGASRCVVRTSKGKLVFEHDGLAPDYDQLRLLYADFGGGDLALQELAIGLHAARGLGTRIVEGQAARLIDGVASHGDCCGARFELREQGGWFSRHRELEILAEETLFPMTLNKTELDGTLELPHLARAVWLRGPGTLRLRNLPSQLEERSGSVEALVGIPSVPLLDAPTLGIVRGVRLELPPLPGCFGVVSLPRGGKDLSQSRWVCDPEVLRLLEELAATL